MALAFLSTHGSDFRPAADFGLDFTHNSKLTRGHQTHEAHPMSDASEDLFAYADRQPVASPPLQLSDCPIFIALPDELYDWGAHPVFTLAKRPSPLPRRFQHGRGFVEIRPGPAGPASILDKDVFVFLVSRLSADHTSPVVRASLREILLTMGRGTSGKDYPALVGAIERVAGMRVEIVFGNRKKREFSLLDAEIARSVAGRVLGVTLTAPDWVVECVRQGWDLPLDHRYRLLRRPLERRLYELSLVYHGPMRLSRLQALTGIESPPKRFREMLRSVGPDVLPGVRVKVNWNRVDWISQRYCNDTASGTHLRS